MLHRHQSQKVLGMGKNVLIVILFIIQSMNVRNRKRDSKQPWYVWGWAQMPLNAVPRCSNIYVSALVFSSLQWHKTLRATEWSLLQLPITVWWFRACMWCSCYDSYGTSPRTAEDGTSSSVTPTAIHIFTWGCYKIPSLKKNNQGSHGEETMEIVLVELHLQPKTFALKRAAEIFLCRPWLCLAVCWKKGVERMLPCANC